MSAWTIPFGRFELKTIVWENCTISLNRVGTVEPKTIVLAV
jgi:hypothetical protein